MDTFSFYTDQIKCLVFTNLKGKNQSEIDKYFQMSEKIKECIATENKKL